MDLNVLFSFLIVSSQGLWWQVDLLTAKRPASTWFSSSSSFPTKKLLTAVYWRTNCWRKDFREAEWFHTRTQKENNKSCKQIQIEREGFIRSIFEGKGAYRDRRWFACFCEDKIKEKPSQNCQIASRTHYTSFFLWFTTATCRHCRIFRD